MIRFLVVNNNTVNGPPYNRSDLFADPVIYQFLLDLRCCHAVKLLHMKEVTVNLHPVRIAMEMIQAVQKRDYPLLRAWALSGVDMDTKDYDGRTAMHEAVYLKDKSMITKLLDYGATPLEKDVWGQTAMDNSRSETAIMGLFDPLFTVFCPTKEDYLLYKANHVQIKK
ncbi:uncharacterized protein si:dkey-9i23.14 isoform X2 [Carassius carassius]|uniref:uncharacterized protein si:dkey-9i23.14 isoform X2 n=1 Tax=Carassius carassius TaxID=217509 RepID=UPI0028697E3E|nr:uncharacterized protein si:dkey-9i23.14 isoform X2 [Carassius carassius]